MAEDLIIKSRQLIKFQSLVHGVSSRSLGNMSFSWNQSPAAVIQARKRLFAALAIPLSKGVAMAQPHGGQAVWVTEKEAGRGMTAAQTALADADALATDRKGLFLFGTFADCVPVLVYDQDRSAVGLAHAGWRGVIAQVIPNLIDSLKKNAGSYPHHLTAFVGPAIGIDHYLVGPDVAQTFRKAGFGHKVIIQKTGQIFLDLKQACVEQLIKSGLSFNHIEVATACTSCDRRRFFSYRRDGKTGAMAAVIGVRTT